MPYPRHSFGAVTTLLVTWHRDLRDSRIQAALPMAPASCFMTRRFFDGVQVPLLVMGGDSDLIFPFRRQSRPAFSRAAAPRFLVRLDEGSHNGFSPFVTLFDPTQHFDRPGCEGVEEDSDLNAVFAALGGADVGIEVTPRRCPASCAKPIPNEPAMPAERHHQLVRVVQAAFFQAYLKGDDAARCFLRRTLRKESDVKARSAGAGRPAPLPSP